MNIILKQFLPNVLIVWINEGENENRKYVPNSDKN